MLVVPSRTVTVMNDPEEGEQPAERRRRVAALQDLVATAHRCSRVSGHRPCRGRWGLHRPVVPFLGTPWQDTVSAERPGWRQRAAFLQGFDPPGEYAFEVDYQTCRRCRLGWVEQPHTLDAYQRHSLAGCVSP
jgi:hypothetical protein